MNLYTSCFLTAEDGLETYSHATHGSAKRRSPFDRRSYDLFILLKSPLLPPRFSMSMISEMTISLSTALHMS